MREVKQLQKDGRNVDVFYAIIDGVRRTACAANQLLSSLALPPHWERPPGRTQDEYEHHGPCAVDDYGLIWRRPPNTLTEKVALSMLSFPSTDALPEHMPEGMELEVLRDGCWRSAALARERRPPDPEDEPYTDQPVFEVLVYEVCPPTLHTAFRSAGCTAQPCMFMLRRTS